MDKPNIDLTTLSFGKIFQIDPLGLDEIQITYGGDFLVSSEYNDRGVVGILASVQPRQDHLVFEVEWKYLSCVGQAEWYKINKEE